MNVKRNSPALALKIYCEQFNKVFSQVFLREMNFLNVLTLSSLVYKQEDSNMKTLNLYGKFLSSADRKSWIDVTRIVSFDVKEKSMSDDSLKVTLGQIPKFTRSEWVVSCNFDKNCELVGIFSSENEATSETEKLLITISGQALNGPPGGHSTRSLVSPQPAPKVD